jgi:hypothetical protein
MITFKVDNVKRGVLDTEYMQAKDMYAVKGLVGNGVEACSLSETGFIAPTHNLLSSINTAYDQHLPLVLSPDMLWLAISQGLSTHITNNAEQLRSQFVNFEGKKELVVDEDFFVKGSPDNNWPHMLGEFSTQLAGYIGKKRDLIVNNFSSTGPVELAASEIVLMEAMSKYFDYTCHTMCGIPEITLLGTPQDWQDILTRVHNISEFDLSWWTSKLEPIMQEFVNAARGNTNTNFWKNIYKESGGSGGPFISGWATQLFPYLKDYKTSEFTLRNDFKTESRYGGYTTDNFPIGMAKVPFKWKYYTQEFKMELAAGFSGFQFVDGAVRPQIGWFVRDTEAMVDIHATFKEAGDWKKNGELRESFEVQLAKFGFQSEGYTYGPNIIGCVPKANLEQIKQIEGLTFSDKTSDDE